MHPYIDELKRKYRDGEVSRREFLRFSTLLGLSVSGATAFLAGCTPAAGEELEVEEPAEEPAEATEEPMEAEETEEPMEAEETEEPMEVGIQRGGELQVAVTGATLLRMEDPAAASWLEFNVYRNVNEYLTVTNQDNVTEPWLLERWEPSDDLTVWDLYLREGIKFSDGQDFTADDVVFNITRWLDPDVGSSMQGLLSPYLSAEGVEKVDDYHVRLNLDSPQVAVPEHLFHYPAAILPKSFTGNWFENAVGTGPFTLEEFVVEERAVLKAREDYWKTDEHGDPLPYLDGIRFINLGTDPAPAVAALAGGEVDITALTAPLLDALEGQEGIEIVSQISSYTLVVRMRVDREPFDNALVRRAIKMCQNREQLAEAAMRGYGGVAADYHVAPAHPEYCDQVEAYPQDHERAMELLAEAGYPDGIEIELASINAEPNLTMSQLLKEQCAPAGITINLNLMPDSLYWEQWMEVDFGITSWTHRPLASMTLGLAYRTGASWNETRWSNEEFDSLLTEVEGTYDLDTRRELMCQIEQIMKEDGPVAIPWWGAFIWGHGPRVKNYRAAPSDHMFLYDVWMEA